MTTTHRTRTTTTHEWTLPSPSPISALAAATNQAEQAIAALGETNSGSTSGIYCRAAGDVLVIGFTAESTVEHPA